MVRSAEYFVQVPGGRVYCRTVEGPQSAPLLTIHGGPGLPHQQLQPVEHLNGARPVIFYDQLGCGRSDRPDDPSHWRIDRFVEELVRVRTELSPGPTHILGYSWGSMVAVNYALTQPAGLRSLVLISPILSVSKWAEDQARLKSQLPQELRLALQRYESEDTDLRAKYQVALLEFRARYSFRNLDPWPDAVSEAFEGRNRDIFRAMWGENPFEVVGNLRGYEQTDCLGDIKVPTLLACGRYDTSTPEATDQYRSLFPQAEVVIFENSSHWAHFEETENFLDSIRRFLRDVDAKNDQSLRI